MGKIKRIKHTGLNGKIALVEDVKKKQSGETNSIELLSIKDFQPDIIACLVTNNTVYTGEKIK